ncbi:hypothetical protein EDD17DRAFT_813808 [Pisolithus thermaeus]|nr:hypothetical protein EDD17DRAFT_813808 [Pisolithus thermaeus]
MHFSLADNTDRVCMREGVHPCLWMDAAVRVQISSQILGKCGPGGIVSSTCSPGNATASHLLLSISSSFLGPVGLCGSEPHSSPISFSLRLCRNGVVYCMGFRRTSSTVMCGLIWRISLSESESSLEASQPSRNHPVTNRGRSRSCLRPRFSALLLAMPPIFSVHPSLYPLRHDVRSRAALPPNSCIHQSSSTVWLDDSWLRRWFHQS